MPTKERAVHVAACNLAKHSNLLRRNKRKLCELYFGHGSAVFSLAHASYILVLMFSACPSIINDHTILCIQGEWYPIGIYMSLSA